MGIIAIGSSALLNVTTEFLWQKYIVYRHQTDTAVSVAESFFNQLIFSDLN